MAKLTVDIPDEFMDTLRLKLNLDSNVMVLQDALTLLNWAVAERKRDRIILSTDQNGASVEKLYMESLAQVLPKKPKLRII